MNGEWNVVKVKDLPHVTPVAEFQCGNLARREEAGSTELRTISILSGRTTFFHRGQTENCSQHDSHCAILLYRLDR